MKINVLSSLLTFYVNIYVKGSFLVKPLCQLTSDHQGYAVFCDQNLDGSFFMSFSVSPFENWNANLDPLKTIKLCKISPLLLVIAAKLYLYVCFFESFINELNKKCNKSNYNLSNVHTLVCNIRIFNYVHTIFNKFTLFLLRCYYRSFPKPAEWSVQCAQYSGAFMWWWIMWHMYYDHGHITVSILYWYILVEIN